MDRQFDLMEALTNQKKSLANFPHSGIAITECAGAAR